MMRLENRIPPPIVALAFALAMAACAYVLPIASVSFSGRGLAAGAILTAGLAVILASVLQFLRARTTVNPLAPEAATSLVTNGLFRFTRNPMYLGMALILAAWAIWLANGVGALLPLGFVAYINRFQIAPEERALRAHFGHEFEVYAVRVRRWI
jgi:protein-S-isoprenylcysteine O-methyltransferase Ste14